jgi:tetratricopeptide (TPR) repeat protein
MLPPPDLIRGQVARILASPAFQAHPRASSFLAYVVGEALEGRAGEIKQATIGCEVFGRPASYDPRQDAIVRSVARAVREKLNDYYLADGAGDPLHIEIPKGTYAPSFRQRAPQSTRAADPAASPPPRLAAWAASVLVVLACCSVGAQRKHPAAPAGDPSVLYRLGRAKFLSGDFTDARPLLSAAARIAPRDAMIHASLAGDLAALGYDALALEEARRAVAESADLTHFAAVEVEAVFRSVSGDHAGAITAFAELAGLNGQQPEYIRELAHEQLAAARWVECLRTVSQGQPTDAQLAITESYCRAGQGDYIGALQPVRRALAIAREAGQREVYARARLLEAGLLMSTGKANESAAAREEARRICAAIGDDFCTVRALRIQANLDVFHGRPAPALAAYRMALPMARKMESAKETAELQDGEGWALMLMDDFAGAQTAFLDSMLTSRRAGMRSVQIGQDLTLLALLRGDSERAAVLAEQAEQDARSIGDRVTESAARTLRARALFERGDLPGCAALLEDVRRMIVRYNLSADVPRQWRLAHLNLNRALGRPAATSPIPPRISTIRSPAYSFSLASSATMLPSSPPATRSLSSKAAATARPPYWSPLCSATPMATPDT